MKIFEECTLQIWGQNKDNFAGAQNSYLFEAEYYILRNSIYTRLEAVQKTRHELGIEDNESKKELIGAYTLGIKENYFLSMAWILMEVPGELYILIKD